MPNGDENPLTAKVHALELLMTWMIAYHAHSTDNPAGFVRTLSNDISGIIDHEANENGFDAVSAASLQSEVDAIIKKAGSRGWLDGI